MNWFQALRLPNLIIIAITQCVLKYGLINPYFKNTAQSLFPDKHFCLLVFTTVSMALFAYLINDYFDHELDRSTDRKMKADLNKHTYWQFAWITCVFGFALAVYLAVIANLLYLLWIFPVSCLVLYLYSKYFKSTGLVGNIVVAAFTSFVIYIVMLAEIAIDFSSYQDLYIILLSFIIFSFVINLYREIIKDLEDEYEDRLAGLHTLPIRIGRERTNLLALFLGAFLCLLIISFGFFLELNIFQRVHILAGLAIPLIVILVLNFKAHSTVHYTQISKFLKLMMVCGFLYLMHAI